MGIAEQAAPIFLMLLVLAPIVGLAVVKIVGMAVTGDLEPLVAIPAVGVLLFLTYLSVSTSNMVVGIAFGIGLVALMATFPFASAQLEVAEQQAIDIEALEKAHAALSQHPDNLSAQLQLAKALHRFKLTAHAVAVAENALQRSSSNVDELKNASVRDMFRNEAILVNRWKAEMGPGHAERPVVCPHCKEPNYPGSLACKRCGCAYLLDLARGADMKSRYLGGLVGTWVLVCALIVAIASAGQALQGSALFGAGLGGCAVAGAAIYWLFRPKRIA